MKTPASHPHRFHSLAEAHHAFGLPKPLHPLISVVNATATPIEAAASSGVHVLSFYKIAYKTGGSGALSYGQAHYDFTEGSLLCAAPNQLIGHGEERHPQSGYILLIHPDFLLGDPLAQKIKHYGFFSYAASEALHLSEPEQTTIVSLFRSLENELHSRLDDLSQEVLLAQVGLLLSYAQRFYQRQFITRGTVSRGLLQQVEALLDDYFATHEALRQGLPTVQYLAERVHLSRSYLSDMLRALTGLNAQQHIHHKLIEKAKEQLAGTQLSVSEIAYTLGFEHSQSFSKLFKSKTQQSPLQFRQSFN
ncbi:helix-turn-helix domain-containing protein [Hymenobacter sp. CRA2]|uniref:helix-turn-helix domain-containing protein n=1 Tax=Hymenobacter sp. CRA2 TaxID=1955620 RepID=UPI00098ECB9D|nr:helix-turn-helix transcriptional regulator [Hymenobacter sp. CRA2]OON69697.1 AraC family transcriptional regulator [Hymenobacter sp. CRA2]